MQNMESAEEEIINKSYLWKICAITEDSKTMPNFKIFQHPLDQLFDFPTTIIRYIMQATSSDIYEKLIATCKYFYSSKNRISVITSARTGIDTNSIIYKVYRPTLLPLSHLQKIWITKKLCASSTSDLLQRMCKKIYKCTVGVLDLSNQKITENEFNVLVNPEFLLSIDLLETFITKSNGDTLNCEEIVEKIPKAISIEFRNILITPQTFSKISKMPRINKLKLFDLEVDISVQYILYEPEQLKNFLKKCAAPKFRFLLHLYYKNETRLDRDTEELQEILKAWVPFDEKPTLYLS